MNILIRDIIIKLTLNLNLEDLIKLTLLNKEINQMLSNDYEFLNIIDT